MSDTVEFSVITDQLRFPEGPIAMPDGSVIVVEICGQALTRVHPDGSLQVIAKLEGGPNGAAMGPDGWCYICNSGGWIYTEKQGLRHPIGQSMRSGWIERVHIETGKVERFYDGLPGETLNSPNDIVFDAHGGFWFTDLGKIRGRIRDVGAVYYAKADGSHIERIIDNLVEPNGIGLSPDGQTVYVAETRTRRILAFDLSAPGKIIHAPWPAPSGGRLVAGLPDNNHLDSLAVDSGGNICVASLNNGGIWEVSADGKKRRHIALPDFFTTNICFGGPDLTTAYATLSMSGQLIKFDWPRPGTPLHFLNPGNQHI